MLEEITNFTRKIKRDIINRRYLKKMKVGELILWNPAHQIPKDFVWCEGQPLVSSDYSKYAKYVEENDLDYLKLPDGYCTVPNMAFNGYCDTIIKVR
jgi:hypothetical protein